MEENEGMEEKDLAEEKKKEFKQIVLEQINKLREGESKMIIGEMEATKIAGQAILKIRGKTIAIVQGDSINYILQSFEQLKQALQEEGKTLDDLGLPDLQAEIDKIQKQTSEQQQEEQEETSEEIESDEETPEKDDEKPDLEDDDPKKAEIAKQYNVNVNQVIHIANDERVTEDDRFQGLVKWAKDKDDVYIIPGEDPYSYKFIGSKDGQQEEMETGINKIGGKSPDVTVKRIDGEQITEVKPLAMYEIDSDTSIAIVKNQHGEPEAIYCRQQEGDEKAYWGSVIPEASGKNVLQKSPEVRDFIDHRNNSGLDLAKKADDLTRQEGLEKRGMPSGEEGVQVEEIEGSYERNRSLNIDKIIEDLMKRDGIVDRATMPPGYYENKAQKVLNLMDPEKGDKNITYEQAIEQVEAESKGNRKTGGRTQGEQPRDPRMG